VQRIGGFSEFCDIGEISHCQKKKRHFLCQSQASGEQNPLLILQNWKNLNIEQHYQSTKQAAQLDICLNITEKFLKGKWNKLFSNYLNVCDKQRL
jgi:hypothetical protein